MGSLTPTAPEQPEPFEATELGRLTITLAQVAAPIYAAMMSRETPVAPSLATEQIEIVCSRALSHAQRLMLKARGRATRMLEEQAAAAASKAQPRAQGAPND